MSFDDFCFEPLSQASLQGFLGIPCRLQVVTAPTESSQRQRFMKQIVSLRALVS
jgi:hypothetical protein